MSKSREFNVAAIQSRVNPVYEAWAAGHADGLVLTKRRYSPDDEYQKVSNVRFEPEVNFEQAQILGRVGAGEAAYAKLTAGFVEQHAEELVRDRAQKSKNTLFATLHLKNVLDTALTHNNFFVTAGGDPEIAAINDVITNPMLAFLDIGGIAVYKALTTSGGIDEALPYRSAKSHGMDKESRQYIAKTAKDALEHRLSLGVAIHWSLSGTRAKKITSEAGEAWAIPRVSPSIAEYAIGRIGFAIPAPINMHPGNSDVAVLAPRQLETANDIHMMMEEMVEAAEYLSGEKIFYGQPDESHRSQFDATE